MTDPDDDATDTGTIHMQDYGSAGECNSTQQHPAHRGRLESDRQEVFDAAVNLDYVLVNGLTSAIASEAMQRLHLAVTEYYQAVDKMIGRTPGSRRTTT